MVCEEVGIWNAKSFDSRNSHVGHSILIHRTWPKLDMWDLNGSNVNFFMYLVEGIRFFTWKVQFFNLAYRVNTELYITVSHFSGMIYDGNETYYVHPLPNNTDKVNVTQFNHDYHVNFIDLWFSFCFSF